MYYDPSYPDVCIAPFIWLNENISKLNPFSLLQYIIRGKFWLQFAGSHLYRFVHTI